jgi:gliding motility-associated-like protein
MNLILKISIVFFIVLIKNFSLSQLQATFSTSVNTNCNGSDCSYTGPTILINELMISPTLDDGSICGLNSGAAAKGEWIELYNPNLCEPIDISCYYLGNNTFEGQGGFVIPPGTIVPANGFCLLRGQNAIAPDPSLLVQNGGNLIDIVIPALTTDVGVCATGTRIWFPNSGGWFAFYDNNGVAQDAVSWASPAAGDYAVGPCVPSIAGCTTAASLASYDQIPAARKNYISAVNASDHLGLSLRRGVDGQVWAGNGASTQGTCNGVCNVTGASSCTGTATISVTGGQAPYTYSWNDSQAQITAQATNLCDNTYSVNVTDNLGVTQNFTVTIVNFEPTTSISSPENICIQGGEVALVGNPIPTVNQSGVFSGTGVQNNLFSPTIANSGNHEIKYVFEDEFGCTDSVTKNIFVTSPMLPAFSYSVSCLGEVELQSLTVSPNYSYNWTIDGQSLGSDQNANTSNHSKGEHSVELTVVDNFGCAYDTVSPILIPAGITNEDLLTPNVITPNGDGKNDSFKMPSIFFECLSIEMDVLNRWGQLVYTLSPKLPYFEGLDKNGNALSEGVYFIHVKSDEIDCKDEKYKSFCTSNITIVR